MRGRIFGIRSSLLILPVALWSFCWGCNSSGTPAPDATQNISGTYLGTYQAEELNGALPEADFFRLEVYQPSQSDRNAGRVFFRNFNNLGDLLFGDAYGFVENEKLVIPPQMLYRGDSLNQRSYYVFGSGNLTREGFQAAYRVVPDTTQSLIEAPEFQYTLRARN